MSNTQRPRAPQLGKGPVVPQGDMGIGLCLSCLGEIIASPDLAGPPQFGVTLAPMPQHLMTPQGPATVIVAVPSCWEHIRQAAGQQGGQPKRSLLVAAGSLP